MLVSIRGAGLTEANDADDDGDCSRSSEYPECGAYVMTSKDSPATSYTMHGCFLPNYGRTLMLQDSPPSISIRGGSSTVIGNSPVTITVPATPGPTTAVSEPASSSPPIGAIVGGVVGGLAVLALLILGIVFMRRRKPQDPATAPTPGPGDDPNGYNGFSTAGAGYGKESPYSPTEASPTFAPQNQYHNGGHLSSMSNSAIAPAPPLYDPRYSVTSSHTAGNQHAGSFSGAGGVGPMGIGNTPSPNPSTDAPFNSPAGTGGGLTRSSFPQTSMVGQAPALIEGDELFDFPGQPASPPQPPPGMNIPSGVVGGVGTPSPPGPPAGSAEVEAIYPFGTKDNRAELSGSNWTGTGTEGR